ncbi:ribosomal protein S16 [Leptospira broomii serovar Hurstbridge str. 5399]|uniref:Small ribosomal subunit protein bS16 n=4 Tax=Leptospira TaxID=171 RepID=V6HLY1_9LEPT|nr:MULTISPECIES: 30S ribosomal protein S16 [Leptospira]EPG75896.1 ribosomal protein S16 [Leptospira fainei serovar Hurstbridge str. BUT 6]EQA37885.1 ribosomal protein S16 [Leptospira inadai serovar Lyme str. 10]EQA43718.1 ribosomal protein S16 [Leptospira broomii serovar Hurstbridge str. 5399]PNV76297.1 30S ribosomal protein S16 [Leptospira inadai serovar Lyme]
MVKIRLQRTGAKNNPHYRVVAADSRSPRDGKFIDILGHYHPAEIKGQTVLDKTKVLDWLKKGAQPTGTVLNLIKNEGIWAEYKQAAKK